jgi:DNA primase
MNVFAVVKENVTARQVAMQYGIKINRSGLACCPFHKDKTPSMKIDKRYYCFGCGDTGDAIDFVAKYFGLAPKEAAMKIASDFGLNYDATNRAPPKKMAPKKTLEQILDEEQKQCFCVLSDYYHLLRKWKTEYAPKSMDEEWHPCFVEALQNISKVEYQLDTLLEKDIPDRASVVSDIGKGVKSIAGRIEEYRRSQGDAGEHRKGRSQENSR